MNKSHPLLDKISGPEDVKALSSEQLPKLAREIRQVILETVSKNGGHLGASLGAVELIIALHRVFSSPTDRLVFDVGHQAYAHKLLTGRGPKFATLRKENGLGGFTNPAESPHDAFISGHASNAISAALGLREALYQQKDGGRVVAVVGDGSLTGGLAYEGLNMAATLPRGLIVILNDNGMFIDPTVGSLSRWLTTRLNHDSFYQARRHVKELLKTLPHGDSIATFLHHASGSSRAFLTPGVLFAALGFRYLGPLDGHNIGELESSLKSIARRDNDEPILVHVKTCKGRGYGRAERDPAVYHGVGPFDCSRGALYVPGPDEPQKEPTFTDIFGQNMVRLGKKYPKLVAVTAAMKGGTGLASFAEKYPHRFYDVGIAEEHAVTFAAGMAKGGLRPVVAIYSTFLQRAVDQVIHDVALQNLPVIFAIDRAGLVGADGATHQGAFDIAMLRYIPNMVLMAPSNGAELSQMLELAMTLSCPVAIRYPRGAVGQLGRRGAPLKLGQAQMIADRAQAQVLFISYGHILPVVLAAVDLLEQQGVVCSVIDARFAKPLDNALLLEKIAAHKLTVTVEEGSVCGGFGTAVLELLARNGLAGQIICQGLDDNFIPHGEVSSQRERAGLSAAGLVQTVLERLTVLEK